MSKRQHKNFRYYLRLISVMIFGLAAAGFIGMKIYAAQQYLPVEKILTESVLKDRKFEAKVQQIGVDGINAYLLEEHSNPIISIRFLFQNAGTAYEPEDKGGLATLLAEMLTAGGGKYDAEEFKELCEEYGIKISFSADTDDFSGRLEFPREHRDIAIKIFKAALYSPRYEAAYFELAKAQQIMALQLQKERPEQLLNEEFKKFIFAGHPYERNALGDKESVSALGEEDLENYRKTMFGKSNLLIGMAGDISRKEAQTLVRDLYGALPNTAKGEKLAALSIETNGEKQSVKRQSAQAVVQFVAQGTFRDSLDFYPLYIANSIFGSSGLVSRLNKVIREEKGLTYGIYTYLTVSDAAALIQGSFSATPENLAEAEELLLKEWNKLAEEGVSEEELAQAKKSLLSSYNLRFAEIDSIAAMLLAMQKYNLGIDFLDKRNDYIKEVSLKEVNAATKKYFRTAPDLIYLDAGPETEEKK